jgi:hypothetical protein
MFLNNDIPFFGNEIRVPIASPTALLEHPNLGAVKLPRMRIFPMLIVARFPAVMGNDENPDT